MAELFARSALAHRSEFDAGGISLSERPGLAAWLVTAHMPVALPGAISVGPHEQLLVDAERPADPPGTALVQDMASALGFLELTGPGVFEALGLNGITRSATGGTATRLADLRVIIAWRHAPEPWLRIAVERPSADYLWAWLERRIRLAAAG